MSPSKSTTNTKRGLQKNRNSNLLEKYEYKKGLQTNQNSDECKTKSMTVRQMDILNDLCLQLTAAGSFYYSYSPTVTQMLQIIPQLTLKEL